MCVCVWQQTQNNWKDVDEDEEIEEGKDKRRDSTIIQATIAKWTQRKDRGDDPMRWNTQVQTLANQDWAGVVSWMGLQQYIEISKRLQTSIGM